MVTLDMIIPPRAKFVGLYMGLRICHVRKLLLVRPKDWLIIKPHAMQKILKVLACPNILWMGALSTLEVKKKTLNYTLIDFYDTTEEKLKVAGHVPGPKCRCKECTHLKDLEDHWIMKIGSLYGIFGLNTRDEVKYKSDT